MTRARTLLAALLLISGSFPVVAQEKNVRPGINESFENPNVSPEDKVPQEVRRLVGTYVGSWTMYGINDKNEVVKRMAWTDTMRGKQPQIKDNRAFVNTADEMIFEGGKIPPFKIQGKEGYYLNNDGTLGAYFSEMRGKVHRLVKLDDNVWSYTATADPQELQQLGFPLGAKGQHVLVKVVTNEHGEETHRISRVTTVTWTGKDGTERALQFVSLQGYQGSSQAAGFSADKRCRSCSGVNFSRAHQPRSGKTSPSRPYGLERFRLPA